MAVFVSENTINDAIQYFRKTDYSKPEQIGLYFYFKGVGINHVAYSEYKKWGEVDEPTRRRCLRILYDLAGIFDAAHETGLKRTALFPFSIRKNYKANAFYNGATVFARLGSRITDTLDNALISTLLQRNPSDSNAIMFRGNSVQLLLQNYLNGHKIPIEWFAAWYYRNYAFDLPEDTTEQKFHDICILGFLSDLGITADEYKNLFHYAPDLHKIEYAEHCISGAALRKMLDIDNDVAPEIDDTPTDTFLIKKTVSVNQVSTLTAMVDGELTDDKIIELLTSMDSERMAAAEAATAESHKPGEPPKYQLNYATHIVSPFPRNRIVFGAPGTGKSYQLNKDKDVLLSGTDGAFERVTFHPEYSYSQFVGCYKPITAENGDIRYEFVPGPFIRVLIDALKSGRTATPQPHLLLIEEINRAKVAAVFGEVFQLLDRNDDGYSQYEIHATEDVKRYLAEKLGGKPEDYTSIRIPDNIFIWATMNSADQGVFPMDTAFKRRWDFEYIGIDENDADVGGLVEIGSGSHTQKVDWNILRKAINEKLAVDFRVNEDKLMGPFFLSKSVFAYDAETRQMINPDAFKKAFKSKVLMYLYEDAAKPCRHQLFSGCDSSRYSSVCDAFDRTGLEIFGNDFQALYDRTQGE